MDADLVLLDADPTAAVANLHAVSGVVSRGLALAASDLAAARDDLRGRVGWDQPALARRDAQPDLSRAAEVDLAPVPAAA